MRSTILTRSIIAVATLGIGSVALATVPAAATSTSGISRDMVLSASTLLRDRAGTDAEITNLYTLVDKGCNVGPNDDIVEQGWETLPGGGSVDGAIFRMGIENATAGTSRDCVFAALATTDPAFTLSGTATINTTVDTPSEPGDEPDPVNIKTPFTLSGDVYVTAPVSTPNGWILTGAGLSTAGNATRSFPVTTSTKVSTPKTTKQKKAAKKAYAKKLKSAKKAYTRALKKAGKSNSKKTKAKKAYVKKKTAAQASYRKAISTSRIVATTTIKTENRAFAFAGFVIDR